MLEFCGFVVESGRCNGDQRDKNGEKIWRMLWWNSTVLGWVRRGILVFRWAHLCNFTSNITLYFY
jgi:hypothetical protein